MEFQPEISDEKSPRRREVQGPRPTPLKVGKYSHKIRKPPPPVIIYTLSPKIIHANPSEFMALVQRLTGRSDSTCGTSSSVTIEAPPPISPAAGFAAVENNEGINAERPGFFPAGVVSSNPASLLPTPSRFFSPPQSNQNPLGLFQDLSHSTLDNLNNLCDIQQYYRYDGL